MEWSSSNGTMSISTSTVRSGAASLRCNPTAGSSYIFHQCTGFNPTLHMFLRAYIYIATAPSAITSIMGWSDSSGTGAGYFGLRMDTNRTLIAGSSTATTGTASAAIPLNTWSLIEVDYDDNADTVIGYLNGVNFSGTVTGANLSGGAYAKFGVITSTTADIYFDDLAVNDNTGSVQNGLAGAGSIVYLRPDAAGDTTTWSTLGSPGVNYQQVNETTPNDSTNTVRFAATGTTQTDEYNVTDSATAGIGPGDSITLVQVGARHTGSATNTPSFVCRIKGQSGGSVVEGSSIVNNSASYHTNGSTAPKIYTLTSYTNPQTSTAWTPSTVDTMQIGLRPNFSTSTGRDVSTLWALVEYVPSTGTNAPAGQAAVSVDAQQPNVALEVNPPQADVGATAYNATVSTSTAVNANAGQADVSTDASPATVDIQASAQQAAVGADAQQASTAVTVSTVQADVGVAASSVTVDWQNNADFAAVGVTAYDATVSTSSSVSAPAGLASVGADAYSATVDWQNNADFAAVGVAAQDANGSVAPNAQQGDVGVTAFDATVSTSASANAPADRADVAVAAYDAVVSMANSGAAQQADVGVTAYDATVSTSSSVNAPAGLANVGADAYQASVDWQNNADFAAVGATAFDATVSTSTSTNAPAIQADAGATAFDATVVITVLASTGLVAATAEVPTTTNSVSAFPGVADVNAVAYDSNKAITVNAQVATVAVSGVSPPPPGVTNSPNPWITSVTRNTALTTFTRPARITTGGERVDDL